MSSSQLGASGRAFASLKVNRRTAKPRTEGITEIRGPYYTPMGKRYLRDIIGVCHAHDVLVSTGGFIEYVLAQGADAVRRYIRECKDLGFDIIEVSSGFITVPPDDLLRLVEDVQKAGLKAKPEVGIQFGAGGATAAEELAAEGTRDPEWTIRQARRFLEAGAYQVMIESEGITENVGRWRTEVVCRIVDALGLGRIMFEAADPEVFAWYIKSYGPEVNLFVNHSQIVQLECLRSGIWGTKSLWGRVLTYKD
jgi:phosphosulfolactate synthase (CoM biosynthesis protein A)